MYVALVFPWYYKNSVVRMGKRYYHQTLLEQCKYETKKYKMKNLTNNDLNLDSSDDEHDDESGNKFGGESGNKSDDESVNRNLYKDLLIDQEINKGFLIVKDRDSNFLDGCFLNGCFLATCFLDGCLLYGCLSETSRGFPLGW